MRVDTASEGEDVEFHAILRGSARYARGRITVVDRGRLEKRGCECYAVVKNEYDRLLPETVAS